MSRAAWYPPANQQAQRYDSVYKGSSMSPNCLVLHTTEGQSWPAYNGGAVAPHLTALPDFANKRLVWRQHFPVTMSARALVNAPGGVETNTANCIQIELVGTSGWATTANKNRDYTLDSKWCWATNATDWMLAGVADFIKWCHSEWGIPLSAPYAFDDWAGNHSHRMSASQWRSFEGVCGHSHVPENGHTDPGAFPIAACLKLAAGGTINQEDDVISDKDIQRIAAAVHSQKIGRTGISFGVLGEKLLKGQITTDAAVSDSTADRIARKVHGVKLGRSEVTIGMVLQKLAGKLGL
jgi:hypothetical protein